MSRRGFVMPIVMLLAIVISLLVGVTLSRSAQRAGVVREQLEGYRESHRQRGVKEMVAAWLKYSADQDLSEMIGSDDGGRAFTVRAGRGRSIEVSLAPAQRTARINPIGLSAQDAALAASIEASLRSTFGPRGLESRTRTVGPMSVDAQRADDSVLLAIADGVTRDAEVAARFVDELRREAGNGRVDVGTVGDAAERVGLDDTTRDRLVGLLGTDPTLWRVRAVWIREDPAGNGRAQRETYEGLIDLPATSGATVGAQHPSELFLEWSRAETADGYTGSTGG